MQNLGLLPFSVLPGGTLTKFAVNQFKVYLSEAEDNFIFIVNKRRDTEIYTLCDAATSGNLTICYLKLNKLTSAFHVSVLLLAMSFVIT